MNLLFDKREQSSQSVPDKEYTQDDVMFHSDEAGPVKDNKAASKNKIKKPKKQMKMGWLYFILIPLTVVVLVMGYLFYFQRDLLFKPKVPTTITQKQHTVLDSSEQQTDQVVQQPTTTESIEQQPVVQNQPVNQSQTDAESKPVSQAGQTRVTTPVTRTSASGQSVVAVQLVDNFLNALPASVSLSSLFIDENTFSVGVSTTSSSALSSYYQSLSSSLPAGAAITTEPKLTGRQTLIAGTYSNVSPQRGTNPISAANMRTQINNIINKNSVLKHEITVGAPKAWNSGKRSLVFVKISGQMNNCQNVVTDIFNSGWDVSLSKIIVMPVNKSNGTLVLRFFLNNPA